MKRTLFAYILLFLASGALGQPHALAFGQLPGTPSDPISGCDGEATIERTSTTTLRVGFKSGRYPDYVLLVPNQFDLQPRSTLKNPMPAAVRFENSAKMSVSVHCRVVNGRKRPYLFQIKDETTKGPLGDTPSLLYQVNWDEDAERKAGSMGAAHEQRCGRIEIVFTDGLVLDDEYPGGQDSRHLVETKNCQKLIIPAAPQPAQNYPPIKFNLDSGLPEPDGSGGAAAI